MIILHHSSKDKTNLTHHISMQINYNLFAIRIAHEQSFQLDSIFSRNFNIFSLEIDLFRIFDAFRIVNRGIDPAGHS